MKTKFHTLLNVIAALAFAANARHKRTRAEIEAWSAYQDRRAPDNPDSRAFFNEEHTRVAPKRSDIVTWFDYLDVDDHVSFGGKA
jgi:hypothetical protein